MTAATLTSVAVFFPMVFMSGIAGQLFKDQALTVTYSLLLSLAVALTLVPMLAAGGVRERPRRTTSVAAPPLGRVPWDGSLPRVAAVRSAVSPEPISGAMRALLRPRVACDAGRCTVLRAHVSAGDPLGTDASRSRCCGAALALFLRHVAARAAARHASSSRRSCPGRVQHGLAAGRRHAAGSRPTRRRARPGASQQLPDLALSYAVAGTGNRLDANPVDAGENTGRVSVTLGPGRRSGGRRSRNRTPAARLRCSRCPASSISSAAPACSRSRRRSRS